jgi:hypothetical protein
MWRKNSILPASDTTKEEDTRAAGHQHPLNITPVGNLNWSVQRAVGRTAAEDNPKPPRAGERGAGEHAST